MRCRQEDGPTRFTRFTRRRALSPSWIHGRCPHGAQWSERTAATKVVASALAPLLFRGVARGHPWASLRCSRLDGESTEAKAQSAEPEELPPHLARSPTAGSSIAWGAPCRHGHSSKTASRRRIGATPRTRWRAVGGSGTLIRHGWSSSLLPSSCSRGCPSSATLRPKRYCRADRKSFFVGPARQRPVFLALAEGMEHTVVVDASRGVGETPACCAGSLSACQ